MVADVKEESTNFTRVRKESMMVIGIEARTSNGSGAAAADIPKLWEAFYAKGVLSKIPNKVSDEVIALYCDYEGGYSQPYAFVIGCAVSSLDEVPEGLVAKTIPASTFAVFHVSGEFPKSLVETWGTIWQSSLQRTYVGDYEVYGKEFSTEAVKEVDVLVAIEEKR
ncbi:MAG: AraC family transcriptional regulator [Nitrospirae bacterium]|nr:AraC family transcriptional regulator [Nitrospirota bacterium]